MPRDAGDWCRPGTRHISSITFITMAKTRGEGREGVGKDVLSLCSLRPRQMKALSLALRVGNRWSLLGVLRA
jgi:hypothetical protein